jgi:hypothetical protein
MEGCQHEDSTLAPVSFVLEKEDLKLIYNSFPTHIALIAVDLGFEQTSSVGRTSNEHPALRKSICLDPRSGL